MLVKIPESAAQYGFVIGGLGTHSSRTMMLSELKLLLAACPPTASLEVYQSAIEEDNVLLKRTQSTRKKSFRHLRELYGLTPDLLVFSALRRLWPQTDEAQPMLALLCALARDPSLRVTAEAILELALGAPVTSQALANSAVKSFPGLSKETTLATIGRNAASSWTQSGHLMGSTNKKRIQARVHPTSVTYALLLSHLCGARGAGLFANFWARVLDHPVEVLRAQAALASKRGWLEYRHMGEVTEVTFDHFLDAHPAHNEEADL